MFRHSQESTPGRVGSVRDFGADRVNRYGSDVLEFAKTQRPDAIDQYDQRRRRVVVGQKSIPHNFETCMRNYAILGLTHYVTICAT